MESCVKLLRGLCGPAGFGDCIQEGLTCHMQKEEVEAGRGRQGSSLHPWAARAGSVEEPAGLMGTGSPGERVLDMPAPPLPLSALLNWTLLNPALWTLTPVPRFPSSLELTACRNFPWPRLRSCCYRPPAARRLLNAMVMVSGSVSSSSTHRQLWTPLILPLP